MLPPLGPEAQRDLLSGTPVADFDPTGEYHGATVVVIIVVVTIMIIIVITAVGGGVGIVRSN